MKRKIFVVTGNTGTGKTTVTKYLNEFFEMPKVVTHTTRAPRIDEMDQVDYYFETPKTFDENHFLETVSYAGNRYGSSMEGLERAFEKNPLITIVLDTKGATTYVEKLPEDEVEVIYLTVSKEQDLYQRLVQRGDDVQAIHHRLKSEEYERDTTLPAALKSRAHIVINDDWEQTKKQINQIVQNAITADT
ncbi:guanylate kinase [Weissella uvarum]|uniref:guanylate kinase n=1 Tax=Weissella uvarum TaxID=1479233 RepID=UPI0019609F71|nr:guanylate kinase [Weissella uvarum]MCM0596019.1 guanylate kinase [Weissella uvarum]